MVRSFSIPLQRCALRCIVGIKGQPVSRRWQPIFQLKHTRSIHDETHDDKQSSIHDITTTASTSELTGSEDKHIMRALKDESYFTLPNPTHKNDYRAGESVIIYGFLKKRKDKRAGLSICELVPHNSDVVIQIESRRQDSDHTHEKFKSIPAHSPVMIQGVLQESSKGSSDPTRRHLKKWDVRLQHIHCLNPFPKDIIVSENAVWPPKLRHMQLRFDPALRDRLKFRHDLQRLCVNWLHEEGFTQIDTPILFKSTPEGAREFLVPTRRKGYAYALPQSPQQYKQILMAGGIGNYFQFARCFRDEDNRADRQPEFTQLDLEMAFANEGMVIELVSRLMTKIFHYLHTNYVSVDDLGGRHPIYLPKDDLPLVDEDKAAYGKQGQPQSRNENKPSEGNSGREGDGVFRYPPTSLQIARIPYEKAMQWFGSDKPDLRIQRPHVSSIRTLSDLPKEFTNMITSLENPVVDFCKFQLNLPPSEAKSFISKFMDALPNSTIKLTPESTPAVFIYDSSKPLNGLSALGHESAENISGIQDDYFPEIKDGDILIMQARKDEPFFGGSTDLGKLRTAIHSAAVQAGLIPKDRSFRAVWIYEFPLFTPNGDDPGQGGASGFSSTHHPFTAPRDYVLLKTDPLKVKGRHYDLVINGVELGGGSQRIHQAWIQEMIMRDVLKMTDEGVAEFSHLLEALRAGCPPHAGFAFGFDRLLTVLLGLTSVRDVIAFPKVKGGEDRLVGSPAKITPAQQEMYHIFADSEE
ncbi:tRNA synthetases class II-domain-containing protein [Hypoxylon trugodes]|uniref:tRNA synthetases class II-domain-containing protein n=1 Tax=Hypoxylon trugodes TaxID=326681 RepID=UPI002198F279|nr:tRNA synthetases class II-domain-containing protein [Hypoxylon trugodes]KAI1384209.1 tRNA synthetases class II-domain-containing protein [Hypoxylon trugodes]